LSAKALGYRDRCAAATEGVEDQAALGRARADDPFEQRLGLLRRVAEALLGLIVDRIPITV
jgi:hypothetical protein